MAPVSVLGEEVVSRTIRDERPTHFALKIKSFSLLSKSSSLKRHKSSKFRAGGYKWRLRLYPNGIEGRNGRGYISLYLVISETNSLSPGWEVHALFRLFLLDQIRDKYLLLQDANERETRFRATKTQSGFDRFITLKEFKDPSKGYLINDTCVFGAEVFVLRECIVGIEECLSMTAGTVTCNHTWKIENFSKLVEESHSSEVFTAGCYNWRVNLWPKGKAEESGKSLSLFLVLDDPKPLRPGGGLYVEAQFRVVDQIYGKHVGMKRAVHYCFDDSKKSHGWGNFLSLSTLRDQSNGYLVKDAIIIEAHLHLIGAIEKKSK